MTTPVQYPPNIIRNIRKFKELCPVLPAQVAQVKGYTIQGPRTEGACVDTKGTLRHS